MNRNGTCRNANARLRVNRLVWVLGFALTSHGMVCGAAAQGQGKGGEERVTTVRGRVLNQMTKEPVARALVTTVGNEYATMTDDRGQFELKVTEQIEQASPREGNVVGSRLVSRFGNTGAFQARKPGFLPSHRPSVAKPVKKGQSEVTVYLVPEALIVGRVNTPGSDGTRIQCGLYQLTTEEGKVAWRQAGSFKAWANGEFRFSELEAGTYRLTTSEEIDRDSARLGPGAQLYGYPPVYYPNTTDFSAAAPISVKAGETAQANITVARKEYYPVGIPVRNPPANMGMNLLVYPMGHWGPGWSLSYNPQKQLIEGMLPDGNYTVEAESFGATGSTGIVNLSVAGRAAQGLAMNLVPNATIMVNVREEFQGRQTQFAEQGGTAYITNGTSTQVIVQVVLTSIDEFDFMGNQQSSQPVEGAEGRTLRIPNVRPGRYRVNVMPFVHYAYAAAIESGGVDLLKQPLVVEMGGAVPPIEITLQDDDAEISGTLEGDVGPGNWQQGGLPPEHDWTVLLLPLGRGMQQQMWYSASDGSFATQPLPPGDYLVAAFDETGKNDYKSLGGEELVKGLEGKAQKIHVEAGEKLTNLRVKVIMGNEGE